MPIIFEELEKILLNWKSSSIKNIKNNRIADLVFDGSNFIDKNDKLYIYKITQLFKSISIKDIEMRETIKPDRPNDKFKTTTEIIIKKKSNL